MIRQYRHLRPIGLSLSPQVTGYLRNRKGSVLVEYAVIAFVVCVAIASSLQYIGNSLVGFFDEVLQGFGH